MPRRSALGVERIELGLALHGADLVEPGLDRREALSPRSRPCRESWRRRRRSCCSDRLAASSIMLAGALARQIVQHGEHAEVRLVGRDRRVLRPGAVGVSRRNRHPPECWCPCPQCRCRRCRRSVSERLESPRPEAPPLRLAAEERRRDEWRNRRVPCSRRERSSNDSLYILPLGNLWSRRALPRGMAAMSPLSSDPPAPSDERHPISCERKNRSDYSKSRNDGRSRIR